jgi:rhomboid family GlyGly-CTERM serine protease
MRDLQHGGTWSCGATAPQLKGSRLTDPHFRLRAVNCDARYGAALLAVCGLLLALQSFGSAAIELLRYDRAAIAAGQGWRLLTAHLIHLNARHAVLDVAGLLLIWMLLARDLRPSQWAVVVLTAAAAIDCGLWLRDPSVEWYLGASGVLHGALAAGAFARLRRGDLEGWILAGLLIAKLTYEQIAGPMPFAGHGIPVVVDAHLYGALGGLLAAVLSGSGRAAADSPGRPAPRRREGQPEPHSH